MRPTFFSAIVSPLLVLLANSGSINASPSTLEKRQCQASLATAKSVATRLQSQYFNTITGEYNGGAHWTDATPLSLGCCSTERHRKYPQPDENARNRDG
ncbi:hypothetical protein DFH09DRAFT_1151471 [Mycena vulgaris]|nr:hypothetical protein DFH09DRAFT_1151471 [Mycena vulgaris]